MTQVQSFGAAETVTGSCHLLQLDSGLKVLIDCGYFQGGSELHNLDEFGFNPQDIDILLLTHAHLDHVGRIPKLVTEGFSGRMIALRNTIELAQVVLTDSANIAEADYERALKKSEQNPDSKPVPKPFITLDSVRAVFDLNTQYVHYNKPINLSHGVKAIFRNAGHILGSATIEIEIADTDKKKKRGKRLVFSGDLGSSKSLLMPPIGKIRRADTLYIESTYGDQNHRSLKESIEEFKSVILNTLKQHGNVIIPSFAIARTQEILLLLKQMYLKDELPHCKVYLDSPMAIKATQIYSLNYQALNDSAQHWLHQQGELFDFPYLQYSLKGNDELQIEQQKKGCIIIAGSGMCSGGRILKHLKQRLSHPENSILFVGYQVEGTLGRQLIDGVESIRLYHQEIEVKAKIHMVRGFSAHADQNDLLNWLAEFEKLDNLYLIHGDPDKQAVLKQVIKERLKINAHIVKQGEKITV